MSRKLAPYTSHEAKAYLQALLKADHDPALYKDLLCKLGKELGDVLSQQIEPKSSICLVCTVEDVDYLAKGLLESLSKKDYFISLVCFWHQRATIGPENDFDIAPIIKRYEEPLNNHKVDVLIVLKSIISSSCVVRTDINEILQKTEPKQIFITAPVAYSGSKQILEGEFPKKIVEKFQYFHFAEDSERNPTTGIIFPGIGGNVYELLGFANEAEKNRYRPQLIKERRELFNQ